MIAHKGIGPGVKSLEMLMPPVKAKSSVIVFLCLMSKLMTTPFNGWTMIEPFPEKVGVILVSNFDEEEKEIGLSTG